MQVTHFVGVRGSIGLNASRKRQPNALSGVRLAGKHFPTSQKAHWIFTGLACLGMLLSQGCALQRKPIHAPPALKYCEGKIPTETIWDACKEAQQAVLNQDSNSTDPETLQLWTRKGMNLSDLLDVSVNDLCKSLKRDEDFAILIKGPSGQLFAIATRENRRFNVYSQNLESLAQHFEATHQIALTLYLDNDCRVAAKKPFPFLKRPK